MNIIYIHQHFCTNEGSSGTRSYDVSKYLAQMGHKVTMVCGVLDIGGIGRLPWYTLFKKLNMDGFDVIVCNVYYSNYQSSLVRMWSFLWFAFLASFACLSVKGAEVVFATSLPLTVGIPAYVTSRIRRIPFVFEVRDICPEGDVICGYLKEGSLVERCLSALEKFMYKKSDKILLVSKGFERRLIERGFDRSKMKTVLLGADGAIFEGLKVNEQFRKENGLEGKTVAIYTGAHGTANGLYYVLDAAKILKGRDDIVIVLLGDGREKPNLKSRAEELGLDNVKFTDFVPKTELPGILAACDIGLMILRDVGPRPVTPNKIFDYMFAKLASIVNFEGPTKEMIEADGTGVFADPKDAGQLAEKILYWADRPQEARAIGEKARRIAFEKYDRKSIAKQLVQVFSEVIK